MASKMLLSTAALTATATPAEPLSSNWETALLPLVEVELPAPVEPELGVPAAAVADVTVVALVEAAPDPVVLEVAGLVAALAAEAMAGVGPRS
jgi:hypothetical protein